MKNKKEGKPINLTRPKTLRAAIKKKDILVIETFLKNNVDPNKKQGRAGNTVLHVAANHSYYEIVELLLKYSADVNVTDHNGFTSLHIAAKNNDEEMIKVLLKNNANILIKDNSGNTAGQIAARSGYYSVAKLLHPVSQPVISKNFFSFFEHHKPEELVVNLDPSYAYKVKSV